MRAATAVLAIAVLSGATLAVGAEVTREEFVARAEPICKASRVQSGRLLTGVRQEVTEDRLDRAAGRFEAAAKALGALRRRLAALPRPPADAARIDTWLGYMKQEASLLGLAGRKLHQGDRAGALRMAAQMVATVVYANNEALPFEFHYCVETASQFT